MTPAEERAERDGLQVVVVVQHDLMSAMTGHPIVVSTVDGTEVLLRLFTADEFYARHLASLEKLPESARPTPMARDRAADLVKPLDLAGWR